MAQTFILSQRQADTYLNQAQKQLGTAQNLNGELAASVAVQNVSRSENLFGQVNTFLGLAQTNNSRAGNEISDMARQAVVEPERQLVQSFTTIQKNIQDGINSVRLSSQNLIARLNQTRYDEDKNTPAPSLDSAGEEVIDARQARAPNAVVSNPPPPLVVNDDAGVPQPDPNVVSSETNAEVPQLENNEDLGINDGATSVVGADRDPVTLNTSQNNGPAAPNDDNITQTDPIISSTGISDGGRPQIAPEFLAKIIPQANPLAKLASQTYTISIYIMNAEEYASLLISQKKVLPTQQLIIQSGGIDKGLGFGSGQRNKYFDVDFYLDDLVINSAIGTQSGTRAHNGLNLDFTVVEPTGFTFIERIRKAVKEHQSAKSPTVSEANQNFLMIIRFYGYDAQGKLVSGSQLGIKEIGSDNNAIVEKWFPFQINNIKYKLSNKTVEYRVSCSIPQTNIAFSQATATIPFDFELSAPDVQTLLNGRAVLGYSANAANGVDAQGNAVGIEVRAEDGTLSNLRRNPETGDLYDPGVNSSAPPKASALSNARLYTQGLCEALNQHQLELVQKGEQDIADQYEIILENVPGLVDAKMARPGKQDKLRSTMPVATTAAEALLPNKTRYDNQTKNWSVTRGTQIVQLIDLVMRNSSYITSQQNIVFDEVTLKPKPQTPVATVQWFRIRSRVTPIGYDNKRRTIAYKTTYTVSRYQINDPRVPVFPQARYRGAHKIYNYWFTGLNSEVLDLDINVEYNYIQTFGSSQGGSSLNDYTSDGRIYEKRYFQNKPNAEGTGGPGDTTTPAAQLAERLYSDADIQKAQLTIVGDPDWLQQSEVFYNRGVDLKPFMPDGSVNSDASEVLYEIRINPVADYNISTGLAEVNAKNQAYSQATSETNLASVSTVFSALTVQSSFRQGKFTQKLAGAIRYFNPKNADLTSADLAKQSGSQVLATTVNTASQADVRRVDNEIATRREQFRTATPAVPLYTDPAGANDADAIMLMQGTAIGSQVPPKPGSTAPSDDAAQISDIVAP